MLDFEDASGPRTVIPSGDVSPAPFRRTFRRSAVLVACFAMGCAGSLGEARACPPHRTQRVVELVNEARAAEGLARVRVDTRLVSAAQSHAAQLSAGAGRGHVGADGSELGDRLETARYRGDRFGETLAEGQLSPEVVVSEWLQSPGHRGVILEPRFREIGVGVAESGGPLHWVAIVALNRGERAGTRGGCHPEGGVS